MLKTYHTTKPIEKTVYKVCLEIGCYQYPVEAYTFSTREDAVKWCEDNNYHFKKGAVIFRIDEIKTTITTEYLK